jgi:hypothetical protein
VSRRLKGELPGHEVHTVVEIGWSAKRNGALLRLMRSEKFEGPLTVDQNIEFQQNVGACGIAVVVVIVRKNRWKNSGLSCPAFPDVRSRVPLRPGHAR